MHLSWDTRNPHWTNSVAAHAPTTSELPMSVIHIHNTLTRQKQILEPMVPGHIGMYVCGPTVYDDCHIGHLMGPILFDAVARWLQVRGYVVRFVNNITDIDDKIINRSIKTGEPWEQITKRYTEQYLGYLKRLHVSTITDHPRCSAYLPQMISYITDLIKSGRAYVGHDGVYYDVLRQQDYGKLSGRKIEDMIAGARIERDACLHHPADFALWKQAKPGEPSWDSPWGAGRPGWHIECSVMSHETLGATFDIHGGGDDLKFPHHENEIAQGEAHGGGYARCWMHNGLIQYDGVKVGKSDPRMKDATFARQFRADHLLDTYGAATVRFLLMQGHYRRPNDFAPSALDAARTALGKMHRQLGVAMGDAAIVPLAAIMARPLPASAVKLRDAFIAAMDDDFNTGAAIASLFSLLAEARRPDAQQASEIVLVVRDLGRLIGLFYPADRAEASTAITGNDNLTSQVMTLVIELRQTVRAQRDFATSDRIRDTLGTAGVTIKDAKDGATWSATSSSPEVLAAAMAVVLDIRQSARTTKNFATADRIRDALNGAGIIVVDDAQGARWQILGK